MTPRTLVTAALLAASGLTLALVPPVGCELVRAEVVVRGPGDGRVRVETQARCGAELVCVTRWALDAESGERVDLDLACDAAAQPWHPEWPDGSSQGGYWP